MTREIKFRGKTKEGQWTIGSYFCMHHNDERNHIHHFVIPENTPIPKNKTIGKIQVEVQEDTVGQFTGLHDKNGKEIYEGDIVRTLVSRLNATKNKQYRNFVIRYDAPHFWNGYDTLLMSKFRIEVIGNIHDNPELLKEE